MGAIRKTFSAIVKPFGVAYRSLGVSSVKDHAGETLGRVKQNIGDVSNVVDGIKNPNAERIEKAGIVVEPVPVMRSLKEMIFWWTAIIILLLLAAVNDFGLGFFLGVAICLVRIGIYVVDRSFGQYYEFHVENYRQWRMQTMIEIALWGLMMFGVMAYSYYVGFQLAIIFIIIAIVARAGLRVVEMRNLQGILNQHRSDKGDTASDNESESNPKDI